MPPMRQSELIWKIARVAFPFVVLLGIVHKYGWF
jgi:hypothetical protein